jgi:hypothetical protein
VRNIGALPPLAIPQVLAWCDAHRVRTGRWPRLDDWRDVIPGLNSETWRRVYQAVAIGIRGLPGDSTLWDVLAKHRGVRNINNLPPLTHEQILNWVDAYRAKHGVWPTCWCLPQAIPGTLDERWFNVHQALRLGLRGLPGGSSLPRFLAQYRGVPNPKSNMKDRMMNTLS